MPTILRDCQIVIFFTLFTGWTLAGASARAGDYRCDVRKFLAQAWSSGWAGEIMEKDRGYFEYEEDFGGLFKATILALGASDHLVVSGTGEGYVITDYLEDRAVSTHARVTAIDLVKPRRKMPPSVVTLFGELLEDLPPAATANASVILDHFGPIAYSRHLGTVMHIYARALKPGGRLFFIEPVRLFLNLPNGKNVPFTEWIGTMTGFKPIYQNEWSHAWILERTDDAYSARELVENGYVEGLPPVRQYWVK